MWMYRNTTVGIRTVCGFDWQKSLRMLLFVIRWQGIVCNVYIIFVHCATFSKGAKFDTIFCYLNSTFLLILKYCVEQFNTCLKSKRVQTIEIELYTRFLNSFIQISLISQHRIIIVIHRLIIVIGTFLASGNSISWLALFIFMFLRSTRSFRIWFCSFTSLSNWFTSCIAWAFRCIVFPNFLCAFCISFVIRFLCIFGFSVSGSFLIRFISFCIIRIFIFVCSFWLSFRLWRLNF